MSDFSISSSQRRRLLAGTYSPLEFATKPHGCDEGAVYVLAWKRPVTVISHPGRPGEIPKPEDVTGVCSLRVPLWFITVKTAKRKRKGFELVWEVRFDVTDLRDGDLWLKRGGGWQASPVGAVDVLPVAPSDEVRRKAREEFDHLRKLAQYAAKQRERSKARRRRAA